MNPWLVDFDFDVQRWPFAAKALCWGAAAMLTLALGYVATLADRRAALAGAERRAAELGAERQRRERLASALPAERERAAAVARELAVLLREFPSRTEAPVVLDDIRTAANARGLGVKALDLAAEQATGRYAEQPIAIRVVGDFHAIGEFVADIASLSWLVTLHDFTLAPASDDGGRGGRLLLEATAKTHRPAGASPLEVRPVAIAPAGDGVAGGQTVPAIRYRPVARRDPFALADAAVRFRPGGARPVAGRVKHPLERHPLGQLAMVGTLTANGERHAFVRAPDGRVHRLTVGDYLGADHGRVRAVSEAELAVVELVNDGAGGFVERPRAIALTTVREAEAGGESVPPPD